MKIHQPVFFSLEKITVKDYRKVLWHAFKGKFASNYFLKRLNLHPPQNIVKNIYILSSLSL